MKNLVSKKTGVFLLVLTFITAIVFITGGVFKDFIMFSPAISAIIATAATDRKWKSLGWNFSFKWIMIAWAIPIAYSALAYCFIWITGLADVPNPLFFERAKFTLGLENQSYTIVTVLSFLYITFVMLIPSIIFCLGEELGWRGLLFPELHKVITFKKAALYSSGVWALWHFPDLMFGNYGAGDAPFIFRLSMFTLMVLFSGVILSWIWVKSKSIWAAAIFHASHNVVIQMFFDRITLDNAYSTYFKGEFGIALVIFTFIFMYSLLKMDKSLMKNKINLIVTDGSN